MLAVYGDTDAMRWVGDGEPLTAEQCEQWLGVTQTNYRLRGYGMFAVVERASGDVVGFCGLVHPGGQAAAEIKYAFTLCSWGKGLATEAVRAMLDYGATVHGLSTILATVAPDNLASQRVLAKAGMQAGEVRSNGDGTQTLCFFWRPHVDPLPTVEAVLSQLASLGIALPPGRVRLDGYGDSPSLSEELLALIRIGRKRAGTSLLWAVEADGQELPHAGDIEIALDHLHRPALVTRIVDVKILPYSEVTAEYASIEGEGDGSLSYWRRAHWSFFSRECSRISRQPSETMPVICSVFEVLDVLPSSPST